MKDEIKEILDCIKDRTRDYVGMNGCLYQDLEREELNLLLDYITNLQEENERLSNWWKQTNVILRNGKSLMVNDEAMLYIDNLEERIEKAIEYIKSRARKAGVQLMPREKKLLEILGDKE